MDARINTFGLKEEELNEIVEYFEVYRIDPVPEGVFREDLPVSVGSFGPMLEDMGFCLTEAELLDYISKLDPKETGHIVLSTFLENCAKELLDRSKVTQENAQEIFKLFDFNGDSMINIEDLKKMLHLFGDEPPSYYVREMLKEADIDGDDMISYDEFLYFTTGIVD